MFSFLNSTNNNHDKEALDNKSIESVIKMHYITLGRISTRMMRQMAQYSLFDCLVTIYCTFSMC